MREGESVVLACMTLDRAPGGRLRQSRASQPAAGCSNKGGQTKMWSFVRQPRPRPRRSRLPYDTRRM